MNSPLHTAVEAADSQVFLVDPEHKALRLSLILLFTVGLLAGYAVINTAVPSTGINILAVIVALLSGTVLAYVAEHVLKPRWPSGRTVNLNDTGVRVLMHGTPQDEVHGDASAKFMSWRFVVNRRSRIPKGWYMLACALEQENHLLSVYTFISPTDFDQFPDASRFTLLQGKRELETGGIGRDNLRLAGEQRRLHVAETERWMHGAEMNPHDFRTFIEALHKRFPAWMEIQS